MANKRFAAHVLMFNCDQFILRMIDNCAPFVEKIYVVYSEVPYTYNPEARNKYKNPTSKEILLKSKYLSKIELIEGEWDREEEQRNACLERARAEGFDYLIIQDADEFYTAQAYQRNLTTIIENPDWDVYKINLHVFWKSLEYIIEAKNGSVIGGDAPFAVNCNSDIRFRKARQLDTNLFYRVEGICYHLSYVLTDEELHCKLNTWTHSSDFNRESWYTRKWINWTEETKNLHPLQPSAWKRAVRFNGNLPECLDGFELGKISATDRRIIINIWDWLEDRKASVIERYRVIKQNLSLNR